MKYTGLLNYHFPYRRKDYFYLNYLDGNPVSWREKHDQLPYEFGMEDEEVEGEDEEGKEEGTTRARFACPTTALEVLKSISIKRDIHPKQIHPTEDSFHANLPKRNQN